MTTSTAAAEAAPSPELVAHLHREFLRWAIAQQPACRYTDVYLTVETAVHLTIPDGGRALVHVDVWDEISESVMASHPGTEVIDGRTL